MGWQFTLLALPTLTAMLISVLLGGYSVQLMKEKGTTPLLKLFFVVNLGLVTWTLFSTLKLLQTDPATKLLFYRMLYFGIAPLGALALMFVLVHTDRVSELRPSLVVGLLAVPAAYLVILFTNPYGLAVESTRIVERGGLVILRVETGPAHLVLELLYNALVSIVAIGLILSEALRLGQKYIPQALLVTVGVAAPFVFVGLSVNQVPPFASDSVNFVPVSAGITSLTLGLAIARYHFLDLPPIAYTTAMEASPDGVLVVDAEKRIIHANERGTELLNQFDAGLGDALADVHTSFDVESQSDEIVHVDAGRSRYLSVRSQVLERQDRAIGWVIVLRDVTELHEQQQQILERNEKLTLLNEILRHDIRNDMMAVLGNARLVQETTDDEMATERLETIVRNGEHATELTESVQALMSTMVADENTTRPTPLIGVLTAEVSSVQSSSRSVEVDVTDDIPDVEVVADDLLGTVFRNLLTNAVRHNRRGDPVVTVSVETRADEVIVRVSDNGPGVPDERKDDIFGRGERGLESPGSGLGLYLVDTVVRNYGGDVRVEDNDPTGATFVVCLPRA
ncbi:PAS domain-containing sensor histidine kinase [Haloprofundus marisrubri]|uniref:histidine kinase n=1 Tax=Haloprofundus marisrubri TaxID=1514971 RepID=A0A0W1R2J8_9EURY|nr:histidine kinase N-terminal 7TM domain-containing protein [Haloprofundus marisrubri]KTG07696.1 PAS domain-containing sensor histidine kinase [Haloprofundus marisrubri]